MTLRRVFFWLHLIAGVLAGLVILIISVTGVALTYQKQMTEWADKPYWPGSSAPGAQRLPVETLISRTLEVQPEAKPTAITFYSDPAAPATIAAGGKILFINPYTAELGGGGSQEIRAFFRFVTDWHRYLGQAGEGRALGRAITGAGNLAFFFIVLSGVYLWWPRKITWFKRGIGGKARDFNWHNVFGFWSAIPLVLIVLGSVVISYPWANRMVYRIAGSPLPVQGGGGGPARESSRVQTMDLQGVDGLLEQASQQVSNWRTINLRLPNSEDKQVTFTIDEGYGGQPQRRSTLVFERSTGAVARLQTFSDQTPGQRARTWLRFVHTGEYYGIPGQTIAGIATGSGAVLVVTGFLLAFRRLRAWIARRRRTASALAPEGYGAR